MYTALQQMAIPNDVLLLAFSTDQSTVTSFLNGLDGLWCIERTGTDPSKVLLDLHSVLPPSVQLLFLPQFDSQLEDPDLHQQLSRMSLFRSVHALLPRRVVVEVSNLSGTAHVESTSCDTATTSAADKDLMVNWHRLFLLHLQQGYHAQFEQTLHQLLRLFLTLPDRTLVCAARFHAEFGLSYLPFSPILLFNHFSVHGVFIKASEEEVKRKRNRHRIYYSLQRGRVDEWVALYPWLSQQSRSPFSTMFGEVTENDKSFLFPLRHLHLHHVQSPTEVHSQWKENNTVGERDQLMLRKKKAAFIRDLILYLTSSALSDHKVALSDEQTERYSVRLTDFLAYHAPEHLPLHFTTVNTSQSMADSSSKGLTDDRVVRLHVLDMVFEATSLDQQAPPARRCQEPMDLETGREEACRLAFMYAQQVLQCVQTAVPGTLLLSSFFYPSSHVSETQNTREQRLTSKEELPIEPEGKKAASMILNEFCQKSNLQPPVVHLQTDPISRRHSCCMSVDGVVVQTDRWYATGAGARKQAAHMMLQRLGQTLSKKLGSRDLSEALLLRDDMLCSLLNFTISDLQHDEGVE